MGNNFGCCRLAWTSFTNSDENIAQNVHPSSYQFVNHGAFYSNMVNGEKSITSEVETKRVNFSLPIPVQHISEREPEDEHNPSLNAINATLFLESVIRLLNQNIGLRRILKTANFIEQNNKSNEISKWSSCGSIFIGEGCLSKPDVNVIFRSISVAIFCLLKSVKNSNTSSHFSERKQVPASDNFPLIENLCDQSPSLTSTDDANNECTISSELYREVYHLYDERVHPLFKNRNYSTTHGVESPDFPGIHIQQQILDFLNQLVSSSLLTTESAIVSLVYLERLISGLQMNIVLWSWRRQLLSCVLLASKVLDDQAVWNADYCHFLNGVYVDDLNELERHTLSLLQFNTCVPPSVYAKYYFDLLTVDDLIGSSHLSTRRKRMTMNMAHQFGILASSQEARVENYSDNSSNMGGGIIFDLPCISFNQNRKFHLGFDENGCMNLVRSSSLNFIQPPTTIAINVNPSNHFASVHRNSSSNHHREENVSASITEPSKAFMTKSKMEQSPPFFSHLNPWRKLNDSSHSIKSNTHSTSLTSNARILNAYLSQKVNNGFSRLYNLDFNGDHEDNSKLGTLDNCNVAYSILNDSSLY